jgi:TrmH family RNA methyltransferase
MLVKSQIKYIQSLSQKKHRDADDVFVAEGPKIINELLGSPNLHLQQLFATEEWLRQNPSVAANAIPVSDAELSRLSFLQTPNQVTAIFKKPVFPANLISVTGSHLFWIIYRTPAIWALLFAALIGSGQTW